MHYASGASGACPTGSSHTSSGSAHYGVAHDEFHTSDSYAYQFGWRYCSGCREIIWPGGSNGACPAFGSHQPGGYDYALGYSG